jgi:DNA-binding PadR family transcriptional regulator
MIDQKDMQANLPLTEATLFIMLSLAPEPKHGYAIMKDVQTLSENRVVLSTGTLYGALKRLLDQGWIERVDEMEKLSDGTADRGRPRKAYTLTRLGQHILDAEVTRLQALVSVARLRAAGRQT